MLVYGRDVSHRVLQNDYECVKRALRRFLGPASALRRQAKRAAASADRDGDPKRGKLFRAWPFIPYVGYRDECGDADIFFIWK